MMPSRNLEHFHLKSSLKSHRNKRIRPTQPPVDLISIRWLDVRRIFPLQSSCGGIFYYFTPVITMRYSFYYINSLWIRHSCYLFWPGIYSGNFSEMICLKFKYFSFTIIISNHSTYVPSKSEILLHSIQ